MVDQEKKIDDLLNTVLPSDNDQLDAKTEGSAYTGLSDTTTSDHDAVSNEKMGEFTLEYMRFENPTYHLTYRGVDKTFCGRDLSGLEYKSTTSEPELLDPCKRCQRVNNQLTEEEQLEQLRARLSRKVTGLSAETEVPNRFESEELVAIMKQLPVSIDTRSSDPGMYRSRLSRAVEGISDTDGDPGYFTKAEMETLEQALEGEGLIPAQESVYLYSDRGRLKRTQLERFRRQRRGGKGVICFDRVNAEQLAQVYIASPRSDFLFLTTHGLIHRVPAHQIPEQDRSEGGDHVKNILDLESDEHIRAAVPVEDITERGFLITASRNGYVKRTEASEFKNIHRGGIRAVELESDDEICDAVWSDGTMDLILGTDSGRVIRFDEQEVRTMGRTARGVRGIELASEDEVVGMATVQPDKEGEVLTITQNGFGKRTNQSDYRRQSRNGVGLEDISTDERNGPVVGIELVSENDHVLLVSSQGQLIRIEVDEISSIGRNTMGLAVMALDKGDTVASVVTI